MLTKRSQIKELLDLGPEHYTPQEYSDCLKKLFQVSKFFGFFRSTVKLIKKQSPTCSLLDVGCGGGLFLLNLSRAFPHMTLKGVDISNDAIEEAKQALASWPVAANVIFALQNKAATVFDNADVIVTTLVCHHLDDEALVPFLMSLYQAANRLVIINDLQRNTLAYFLFGFISPLLFRNRLITYDGLISIRRSFTRAELVNLLARAGIDQYRIKWCLPFRWQIQLFK